MKLIIVIVTVTSIFSACGLGPLESNITAQGSLNNAKMDKEIFAKAYGNCDGGCSNENCSCNLDDGCRTPNYTHTVSWDWSELPEGVTPPEITEVSADDKYEIFSKVSFTPTEPGQYTLAVTLECSDGYTTTTYTDYSNYIVADDSSMEAQ
ncbi:MAG: hypothetical protein HYY43_06235 [Deltaproteobacteria bacterium]|nr:hypothetical protein [Deltaproteobacteria bacterium]MBI2975168.1 hypothetical protein [Deltaproteobacteria bacterium]